jgi:hypothetical protein
MKEGSDDKVNRDYSGDAVRAQRLGDQIQDGLVRPLVLAQHSARIPQVAHQHGAAEAVMISAMLPHEGKIRLGESGQADQLALVLGERQQPKALGGGQQLAARHDSGVWRKYGRFLPNTLHQNGSSPAMLHNKTHWQTPTPSSPTAPLSPLLGAVTEHGCC